MAVESLDDLAGFFEADEFADEATIAGSPVNGIFEYEYVETMDVTGVAPTFTASAAELIGVGRGDGITVRASNYTVEDIQPDGTGVAKLILSED